MNYKISVIIPIYNREKYIEECIESIKKQTIREIEIICVDDGSTDSSVNVIQEMQKIDDRIILIKQSHIGAGAARNKGIEAATGEYIAFLDSDDLFYEADSLESLYDYCKKYCVKASCAQLIRRGGNNKIIIVHGMANDLNDDEDKIESFYDKQNCLGFTSFIYEREWIQNNKSIRFPEISKVEDPIFLVRALYDCGIYYCMNKKYYLVRSGWQEIDHLSNNLLESIVGWKQLMEFAYQHDLYKLEKMVVDMINRLENIYVHNLTPELLGGLCELEAIARRFNTDHRIQILYRISALVKDEYLNRFNTEIPSDIKRFIAKMDNPENTIRRWFRKKGIENCLVYGVGTRGNAIINLLLKYGINIIGTIDAKNNHYKNINYYAVDDEWPDADVIIVTPRNYQDILLSLEERRITRVIELDEMMESISENEET